MRTILITAIVATFAGAPAFAQVTPNNAPGTDSMSRATHPDATSRSAPEAATRSDSSTDPDARKSEVENRNMEAPNKTNRRPDQQK